MLTRAKARRWALWAGVWLGAASLLMYVGSAICTITRTTPSETLRIGGGAIVASRHPPVPPGRGAAPSIGFSIEPGLGSPWYLLPRWREEAGVERIVFPYWIVLAGGILSAYFLLPEKAEPGKCSKCSFDLSGAPQAPADAGSIRCPECGTVSTPGPQPA
jgi:hypothetical protein